MDENSTFDVYFALIPITLSREIQFKFYKPDGVTLYNNVYAELQTTESNETIGRVKTNNFGEASFNIMQSDNNYNQILNNGEVTYNPVTLTILYLKMKKPKPK